MAASMDPGRREALTAGLSIPAHPLALDAGGELDERHQRALSRYYLEAGAGGLAVGVHATQFAIREVPGLLRRVLAVSAQVADEHEKRGQARPVLVAGVCGDTEQAVEEAALARELGYDAGLLSLAGMGQATEPELLEHARVVGESIPLFGFYLQEAVGGRQLSRELWRRMAELPATVAIKVAPFDRYRTLDVIQGVAESGRASDVALYTGNDDSIVVDLLARYRCRVSRGVVELSMAGGLLGHWAVWTRRAVEMFHELKRWGASRGSIQDHLRLAAEVTDANGALFDAAHGFRGCVAGVQHVLHRQGLLASDRCLDPRETLSPGQAEDIQRVRQSYPHLLDDDFVAAHRDRWLA